jgi:hypothetical protein
MPLEILFHDLRSPNWVRVPSLPEWTSFRFLAATNRWAGSSFRSLLRPQVNSCKVRYLLHKDSTDQPVAVSVSFKTSGVSIGASKTRKLPSIHANFKNERFSTYHMIVWAGPRDQTVTASRTVDHFDKASGRVLRVLPASGEARHWPPVVLGPA